MGSNILALDLQPEVNSRLAQFIDRTAFPKLMRVLPRLPLIYRNALSHLEKRCWCLTYTAKYWEYPPPRATIRTLGIPGGTVDIPSSFSTGLPSARTTAPDSEPPKRDKSTTLDFKVIKSKFIEEPLGNPATDGHGYAQFDFGDTIGPENRYKIVRKLGWGMYSSIWMAFDEQ